jgi:LmbE family N-acetylglucosaminyl deacetylase
VRINSLHGLGRYDCLFISAHPGDIELSCAGRLFWERERGQRVLSLVVFGGGPSPFGDSLDAIGVDEMSLDLAPAPRRHPAYGSFAAVLGERQPDDDDHRTRLAETLDQVVLHTQARHLYLPLGIGGHIDHLLVHEAGSLAVPEAPGREIFFYEDRPYAFLPGAVWIRLGQLGARLPPAAHLSLSCGLTQYLVRFQLSSYLRAHATGFGDRMRSNGAALRHWMDARGWHPRRACGPRLQPIEHPLDTAALDLARRLLHQHALGSTLCTATPRTRPPRRAAAVPRLRRREEMERYWLLLPALTQDLTIPPGVVVPDDLATPASPSRG